MFNPLFMKNGTGLFYWGWRMVNPHFMKSGLGGARQIFGRGGRFAASGRDEILVGVGDLPRRGATVFSYFNFSPLTTDKKKMV